VTIPDRRTPGALPSATARHPTARRSEPHVPERRIRVIAKAPFGVEPGKGNCVVLRRVCCALGAGRR
jgi:hypothetical protein